MAGIYVNDEGTWKLPKSIWVNQLGTWRVCSNVYVNKSGAWKEMIKSVDITSSKSNFNLYEHIGSPAQALSIVVNIASFVEIFSQDTSGNRTPAFTVGNFPNGSTVVINNNGYISGGGGFGGVGGTQIANAQNGTDGGDGIIKGSNNNFDITIVNTGTIASGGGGGGGGVVVKDGSYVGTGGQGGQGAGITALSRTQGQVGSSGSCVTKPSIAGGGTICGGKGGDGGANGEDGESKSGNGGKGGIPIGSGIEVAVSGTILGEVG
jgi:hypothetical protein